MDPTTQPAEPQGAAAQLGFASLGTALIDTTFVVVDLETTGLSADRDRITEVGAVKVRGGEVLGELRTFVHPGRPIPPAVSAITGITDAMVRDAPPMPVVLPLVVDFLGPAVLVAHNAAFDLGFLRAAAHRHGHPPPDPVVVDTARLARRLLRGEVRDVRLGTLAAHLRTRTRPEHRALADARATADVLHGLLERAGSLGATTLEDLRALMRSTSDRAFRRIDLVRGAPQAPGVYRFLDTHGAVLYVGKATDLRARLRTYFGQDRRRRIADLLRETDRVTWTPTATLIEAEVREVREIHAHRPRYNRRSRQPERAVHLGVTHEPFPRLVVTRSPGPAHRRTLGPVPSRRRAEQLIAALQEVVAVRPCTPRLRVAQDHAPCVLKDLGRCGAPCDGTQSREAYARVVADLESVLDDPLQLLEALRVHMQRLADAGRFERASEVRGRLHDAAQVLMSARRHAALVAAGTLVTRRRVGDATQVLAIRNGLLAASATLPGDADDTAALAAVRARLASVRSRLPTDTDAEEVALLLAELDRPGQRIVDATHGWSEPLPGGKALADTVTEARRVHREVRRDRQALDRAKVVRRDRSARSA